jgi:hypothetical protein
MKNFLKIVRSFFVFLGIIFFILILGLTYLWIADPFNLKVFIPSDTSFSETVKGINSGEFNVDEIDIPSEITPEMEECFVEKLGQKRVEEITDGDDPTANDILKAGVCFENK